MVTYLLFIIGFLLLIKGADLLVDGASSVARNLNVAPIAIGLTIVAFGTSTPELMVNIFASVSGNTEIAIGNILGSNIVNILFILGLSAVIFPLMTKENTVWKEIPFSLLAAALVGVMANDWHIDGNSFSGLTRIDGIVLLAFFIIFLYYTFGISKVTGDYGEVEIKKLSNLKSALYITAGLAAMVAGGNWIVEGAVAIAAYFHVSESLIGLTIVAVGTSLPELATSAVAAWKKQPDIAIGNIVGSNIFNIFFILGVSAVIRPLPFLPESNADIFMTVFASMILFVLLFIGKRHIIEKWQGVLMILIYVAYVAYLVARK